MTYFKKQIAVVTGATRGIGRAISIALLQKGATVLGIYGGNSAAAETLQNQCADFNGQLQLYKCNVADSTAVTELFSQIETEYESIDILVNSAGIRRDAVLALMKDDDWQSVLDVNLTGTFLMCKQAVLLMMKKKYGRIINISSPAAHVGFAGQTNYSASKAGQIGLTRSLAKEVAKKKITVNCVSPGFIATDFIDDLPKEQVAEYKKLVPMRRFGKAEEVADAVLFLAGSGANYITGSVIDVNGGL